MVTSCPCPKTNNVGCKNLTHNTTGCVRDKSEQGHRRHPVNLSTLQCIISVDCNIIRVRCYGAMVRVWNDTSAATRERAQLQTKAEYFYCLVHPIHVSQVLL